MVFGSTSANTSTTKVSTPVAIATLGVAVQAHADDGAQRRGENVDKVIADQHKANQAVRLAQQLLHALGGAVALFRHVAQPVAVQRHHAGFGTGEIGRDNHHDDQRYDQRGGGDMFHVGFLKRLSSRTAAARGYQNRPASADRRQRR